MQKPVNLLEHDTNVTPRLLNQSLRRAIGLAGIGNQMSLAKNINARKKANTSRPKSKSTVSPKAYADMKAGWPKKKKKSKT